MTHQVLIPRRPDPNRLAAMHAFRKAHGWGHATCSLLAGDASFRTYYRLRDTGTGETCVLMDAPPPTEDVRPFVRIGRHLAGLGLSTPSIRAEDAEQGFLLLEDFGDDLYARLLGSGSREGDLYSLAMDVQTALHQAPAPDFLPAYDDAFLLTEVGYLPDWFCLHCAKPVPDDARAEYDALWNTLFSIARAVPERIVLRDYHAENLMLLPGRQGLKACGLLDFQGAVRGPLTYDLMSLMEDARRDIDPGLVQSMQDYYLDCNPGLDRDAFQASWSVMAAQRHAKVIGLFVRLWKRDGKPVYLPHLPRVWRLMEQACQHPLLGPLNAWLNRHVPHETRQRIPA
ncbi:MULTISPECIES: aminoglycoside phosphotransferase family protein [unclassified Haematospirillum]|uniref:aminoglycoside phosphotransferase family protein n=1 Tax=unclassified Haematospirillum TaxID=2622088 RepID=UPI0014391732|nr:MULTISPECIES: phosphotransferase [unclassified Haematospirillum]NKD55423.1 phosphotransferase [Haematospirillum sp. H4890]NKD75449.1 phosphotransferase [Haematospirillum sp. H4485]